MAGPRAEESLLTSLRELRSIEDQRLIDEHAAREAAVQAKRQAREAAEQAARDAHAAQLRERRQAELAAEQARDAAARSEQRALELAQAAELARAQIALDHRRLAEDSALRREVAQRQRPRWMVAVTALSLGAAIALGWFAAARAHDADQARVLRDRAIAAWHEAQADARDARQALDRMSQELAGLEARIEQGLRQLEIVKTEAERRDAQAALDRLRAKLARHPPPPDDVPRRPRIQVSDDCLYNVLCK